MRICRIATIPFSLIHNLGGQLDAIVAAGHELHLVCSRGPGFETLQRMPGVTVHALEMARMISPIADLRALVRLWRLYRRGNFDIVHSTTPKAGLLSALAGLFAGVPLRLHTFTGQPWVTLSGLVRWCARMSDWLITHFNTQCYADSASQRDFLIAEGLCRAGQVKVLGAGEAFKGQMGGLLLETPDKKRFTLGTGFSQADRRTPPAVGSWVTYRYRERTPQGIPRFASFVRVRGEE